MNRLLCKLKLRDNNTTYFKTTSLLSDPGVFINEIKITCIR